MDGVEAYWLFIAGIALFLLGMRYLEDALRQLAGRPFKQWLRRISGQPMKALLGGTLVTMVLQSSSVVNLLVLAMVGSGILGLRPGLSLVLGANLGTTATSWLIALVGFQLKIESAALPLMGLAGIAYFMTKKDSHAEKWLLALFGFGLLFTGLGFIKTGAENWIAGFPLAQYAGYPVWIFLLIGLVLSSIVQSSSLTMAITLSVLATGTLQLTDAMAVALGAEVGTTLKVVLASLGQSAPKKRLAAGNFLFNLVSTIAFMFLLHPVAHFITDGLGVTSPVMALVIFQTLVNLTGILVFLPWLGRIAKWLDNRFTYIDNAVSALRHVPVDDTDIALELLTKEVKMLIHRTLHMAAHLLGQQRSGVANDPAIKHFDSQSLASQYALLKQMHGEIFAFYMRLQAQKNLTGKDFKAGEKLIASARNTMYAAKSFKDTIADADEFANSGKPLKYELYRSAGDHACEVQEAIEKMLFAPNEQNANLLLDLYALVQSRYRHHLGLIYQQISTQQLTEIDVSSAINFNRELTTAFKSIVLASKDLLLNDTEAAFYDAIPGFIH